MMERLREGVNGIAVKIILGLIICSFLFAGVGGYITAGNVEPAALVGEREISVSQFEQAYQNERQQAQAQSGEMITTLLNSPDYLYQFRRSVLDRMVNQSLLDQYVDELGFRVSENQIKQAIREIPSFSSNGIFNNEQYLEALRRSGLTTEQFAEFIRQDLEREYFIDALQGSEFVLENEIEFLYNLEGQTRKVRTLRLPLADFARKVEITQEQMKAYYEKNSFQFLRPEQFKISYVELSGATLADVVDITEEEALAYYQANIDSFGSAPSRKVSHIMIEGGGDKAKEEASLILTQLKSGGDFATLAKTHSDDTFSAEQGGQLDWFEKGVMDPVFEEAAFALNKKGDLSEIVESEFGVHIIKLDEVKPSNAKPFDEMRLEILAQLKQQKAAEVFYERSTLLAEKAFEIPDNLDDAANEVDAIVQKTDFIALADLQGVLSNPSVFNLFQQPEVRDDGLNSEMIEIGSEHVLVVRVNEVRPEVVLPFAEVERQVETILLQKESEKAALELVKKLITELDEGKDSALKESGYSFSEEQTLVRQSPDRDVAKLAFKMPTPLKGKTQYAQTQEPNGDLILVALDEVKSPESTTIDLQGPFADRMVNTIVNLDIDSVIGQLRERISVTYSLDKMEE